MFMLYVGIVYFVKSIVRLLNRCLFGGFFIFLLFSLRDFFLEILFGEIRLIKWWSFL